MRHTVYLKTVFKTLVTYRYILNNSFYDSIKFQSRGLKKYGKRLSLYEFYN